MGCGVWGFTGFEVANYLIFREKVPEFSPQSLQSLLLFDGYISHLQKYRQSAIISDS
ncbi:Type IV pilin PilA [Microcystis panniformis FACHB-1757]|uniref:Type IV pilin PilA n=1 Tax=Microcystis panniformis FACHB-1757 TaxID=1638788 RepID=A0A0K1S2D2_9CHRO|nr:Type IV pilin PilA [Microcystis panniformis FACHB-1757]